MKVRYILKLDDTQYLLGVNRYKGIRTTELIEEAWIFDSIDDVINKASFFPNASTDIRRYYPDNEIITKLV